MPKKESPYSQAMEEDAKNGYPLLINKMKMDGRSEDYIKKFIDGMKAGDAKRCERENTARERARFN